MASERLQKVMANAGVASRRACEEMIRAGRVTVNGAVVTEMGLKVNPRDKIEVDELPMEVHAGGRQTYLMLYKPPDYLSVFNDDRGRQGLEALVDSKVRLYPVGRLDADSEGLLLLTNDGDLTLRLSHPRYEHAKIYYVLVDRRPGTDMLARFRRGVDLGDTTTAPSDWRILDRVPSLQPPADGVLPTGIWLQVTLREGRKRQIRRMAAVEKLVVRRLIRVQMGSLRLDPRLKMGESRPLTRRELQQLRVHTSGAKHLSAAKSKMRRSKPKPVPEGPPPRKGPPKPKRSTGKFPPRKPGSK